MQIYRYMMRLMLKVVPYLQRNSLQLPKLNCNIGLDIFYFQILLPRPLVGFPWLRLLCSSPSSPSNDMSSFSAKSGVLLFGALFVRVAKCRAHLIRGAQSSLRILADSTDMATELADDVKEEGVVGLGEPHIR